MYEFNKSKKKYIEYDNLIAFSSNILREAGLDDFSLESVAYGLCDASLRGFDSHGIRLFEHYVNSAVSGRKNISPNYKITDNYPTFVGIDADHAFGLAAGEKAMDVAMPIVERLECS